VFLVDASVWVGASDPGDRFYGASSAFVLDLERDVAALDLTLYEVANSVGVRRHRPDDARYLSQLIVKRCQGRLVSVDSELVESSIELALKHGLSAYDAAYVAAAERFGWTLVSIDMADLVSKGLAVTPDAADYP
jgi:predicted nucleic acid-binding protein